MARPDTAVDRVRRAARPASQHAGAVPAADLRGPDRAAPPAAVPRRRGRGDDLRRGLPRALCGVVPRGAGAALRRTALAGCRRRSRDGRRLAYPAGRRSWRWRWSPTTSSSRPPTSTTTGPTCSSCWPAWPSGRAGASSRSTPGCAGAGDSRPLDTDGAGLAVVAAAVRGVGRLRRLGPEQAGRPGLVRRHGDLAAHGQRRGSAVRVGAARTGPSACSPIGRSTSGRPRSIVPDRAVHRDRPVVADSTRYAAVWVAVVLPRRHPAHGPGRGVLDPGDRRPRHLGGSRPPATGSLVDATRTRSRRLVGAVPALDWLARFRVEPGPPSGPAGRRRPGRHRPRRPGRGELRLVAAARHRLVLPACGVAHERTQAALIAAT